MGTIKFLYVLLCVLLIQLANAHPGKDSSEEDSSQQQQQQNIDSESIEQFTQKLQSIKGRRQQKPQVTEVQQPEPEAYDPCLDSKKIGPCKARIPRYFFNQATGSCDRFGWGGCGKNGNNFRELSECETSCSKHLAKSNLDVEQTDKSSVVENCEKPPTNLGPISCAAYIPRWTYNATEEQCVQYIWGGCGKTENNFATEAACKATCSEYPNLKRGIVEPTTQRQPSADIPSLDSKNVCELPSDSGLCLAYFEKYHFNQRSNRCELFTYGGCGGNKNRFDTAEDCMRACGGDSPVNDIQCSDVECPWALYEHYTTLGCSPIYDGDACCPTRYDCPNQQPIQNNTLEARSLTLDKDDNGTTTPTPNLTVPQKCRYRGKYYAVGEMVDEASDTGSCRAGCICTDSYPESGLGPKIMCAQIECPEHLSGRPRGKENCLPLYKKGSCCAYDYYCPEEGLTVIDPNQKQEPEEPTVAKCNAEGEGFYEGQRVYPKKSPCSRCLCQRNPDNETSLEGQLHCEKVDCGIEIYYSHHLARGCAPVYFEKEDGTTSCCPISWECPEDKQQESDNEDSSTPGTQPEIPSTDSPSSPLPPPPPPSPSSSLTRSAEACGMEKAEGDCKGSRPRFFYNTESKTCESFVYTGCNGNFNNFASYEDCRDLCEPIIALPAPAKGGSNSGLLSRSSLHTPRSQQEPKAISLTEVDPCTQPKRVGRCKGAFPRFYYSPEENECKLFLFGGCRPNENNFYTKDSCEATCLNNIPVENLKTNVPAAALDNLEGDASKVNFGDEIKTIYLRARRPTPPTKSSASQSSEESNPCALPPRTGRCKAYVRRYYFDNEENTCKHFTYGGCAGNSNNFRSLEECNQRCPANSEREMGLHTRRVGPRRGMGWRSATPDGMAGGNQESVGNATSLPPIASLTTRCKLPQSSGSCYASIPSYYYDVESKSCELFFYSGCFGNANRFITQEECETVCKKPLESEGSNSDVTTIRPGGPQVHELQESAETNSASLEEQDKKQEFCKLDPAPGDCKENQLRFYYDSVAEQCLPFVFTGCKGNENNFVTEAECMSTCGSEPTLEQLSNDLVLSCTFGNITLPLGASLAGHKYEDEPPCGIPVCQCITPPAVSCVHRKCPQPTTTTTEKICGTPTCLHFCRQAIGPDGCPTCDCNFSVRKGAQPDIVTKYIPPPGSVKG